MNSWQFTPYAGCYLLAAGVSFLLSYMGWKMRPVLLGIVPVITFIQILVVQQHNLFYRVYKLTTEDGLIFSTKVYGPGFYLWTG